MVFETGPRGRGLLQNSDKWTGAANSDALMLMCTGEIGWEMDIDCCLRPSLRGHNNSTIDYFMNGVELCKIVQD